MEVSVPILTVKEAEAVRSAQLIAGGIGHAEPDRHHPGMEQLAKRVRASAQLALLEHVRKWQGYVLVTKWFSGLKGVEIADHIGIKSGNISRIRCGTQAASLDTLIIAKWTSGSWDLIDLPPRCDVNEVVFSAALEVVIPALKSVRDDVPIPDQSLSKQEVELIGVLHRYAERLLSAVAAARNLTNAERGHREAVPRFVTPIRRHLEQAFPANLPRTPLLGVGDPVKAVLQMSQFYAEWTFVWRFVGELLDRGHFAPLLEPVSALSHDAHEPAAL